MIARNRNHGFDVTVLWDDGGDELREIRVVGEISRYYPAQGPTYDCGGQPAEGGDIEDYKVFERVVNPLDDNLKSKVWLELDDESGTILEAVIDDVMEQASEDSAGDACDAADARRDAAQDR